MRSEATAAAVPWAAPTVEGAPLPAKKPIPWSRFLPFVGPIVLFIVWDLVVRAGLIKPIQLRSAAQLLQSRRTRARCWMSRRLPADVDELRGSEPQRVSTHFLESRL